MKADVSLDDLCHQAIQCPATRSHKLQDIGALLFRIERTLDGFNLPSNASDANQEFLFSLVVCAMN
jgi:hypothetical protein